MRIDQLFSLEEQIDILLEVARIKDFFERKNIAKNQRHYFSEMADRYALVNRIWTQLGGIREQTILEENIVTNQEIGRLFGVDYTAVTLYLRKAMEKQDYKYRVVLCLRVGGGRGGRAYIENFRNGRNHKSSGEA